ncbi:MAG TPA: vWA domain-containing protein [Longimicrobium sp.]|nr:vWA domain-containing protein [Longimicrobium sp.]
MILILLDQSGSMEETFPDGTRKAEAAALAVNRVIYEIQEASQAGEKIKDRCMVAVIGYGERVSSMANGMISRLADHPLRIEELTRRESDGAGGLVEVKFQMPVWVDPVAENGTPMGTAFEVAHDLLSNQWLPDHPDSFPPIVINLTDGEPDDVDEARDAADKLRSLQTSDGSLLLFNAHISGTAGAEVKLPHTDNGLADENARFLFDISSPLPDSMLKEAHKAGFSPAPQPGARGFVYNAGAESMIKLLTFGSSALR